MLVVVTGVSRGIGKAIAERFISNGDTVIGIGRSNTIAAPNFKFVCCDLSDSKQVDTLRFPFAEHNEIVLVNNAGAIGEINRIADIDSNTIEEVINVNTIAPMLLSQLFCKSLRNQQLTIVNISSGAGKRPIASWASYCASKAALDLFSETLQIEEIERNVATRVYSVAPGVVDTAMQEAIRNSENSAFSLRQQFVDYHKNQALIAPATVADQILRLVQLRPTKAVVFSLKDLEH